jgi:ParB-like chromosome segregation protein Spo0J
MSIHDHRGKYLIPLQSSNPSARYMALLNAMRIAGSDKIRLPRTSEFGFKIPVLARSDGEVVDGHLRLKAARKLGITDVPVILCDEWTPAQVKAFRLMVNRSVSWADWDEELLALELDELRASDFDLSLTGFDIHEIDTLLAIEDDRGADTVPPVPENPITRLGDLWLCGKVKNQDRILCGDSTSPRRSRGSWVTASLV